MPAIAYLTMEDLNGFFIYDHLTYAPLKKLGYDVVEIPWTRQDVNWSQYCAVVIRSTWDYQKTPERFVYALRSIEESGALLLNSAKTCGWNMNKKYLSELEARQIRIVPTIWSRGVTNVELERSFDRLQSEKLVVKPIVGANADDTFVVDRTDPTTWIESLEVFAAAECMIQPFVNSVVEVGEYSLFYFSGEFSHAILKKPRAEDFRVQEEHGGTIQSITATAEMLTAAERLFTVIDDKLLYARVDFVRLSDDSLALIELELVEPSLYFSCDQKAPERFAQALHHLISA